MNDTIRITSRPLKTLIFFSCPSHTRSRSDVWKHRSVSMCVFMDTLPPDDCVFMFVFVY